VPKSRLALAADARGVKCVHIARVMGVAPWKLSRIAAGVQQAPQGFFERVAGMLGCDPAELRPDSERQPIAA
jgi:hypothetical protein